MTAQAPLPAGLDQFRMLSAEQSATILGYSLAHFRKLYRKGKIPRGRSLGGRKLGWPTSVIVGLASPDGGDQR